MNRNKVLGVLANIGYVSMLILFAGFAITRSCERAEQKIDEQRTIVESCVIDGSPISCNYCKDKDFRCARKVSKK